MHIVHLCISTKFNVIFFLGLERYLVSTLEDIKDRLSVLERSVAMIARSSTSSRDPKLPEGILLPLKTSQDLNSLEQKLEDSQCQKELVGKL